MSTERMIMLADGSVVYFELYAYLEKLLSQGHIVQVVDDMTVTIVPEVEWEDAAAWLSEHAPSVAAIIQQHLLATVQ
jgi:hypothetical protein